MLVPLSSQVSRKLSFIKAGTNQMFIYYLYQGRTQQEVPSTVHSARLANTVHL